MVVKDIFAVRLVNATNKEAFPEHTDADGMFYAEVEPSVNFYIEIEILAGSNRQRKVKIVHTVDGKDLGYTKIKRTNRPSAYFAGLRSHYNGVTTNKALSFDNPRLTMVASHEAAGQKPSLGSVKIDIYEALAIGAPVEEDQPAHNHGFASIEAGKLCASLTQGEKKKILRSGEGDYAETKLSKSPVQKHERGQLLESIRINYGTTVGLIQAGLFAQPSGRKKERTEDDPIDTKTVCRKRVKKEPVVKKRACLF